MAIFKCKICGGTLNIEEGSSVAVCEYCGTKQTMPRLDSEKKINLYDRADHFRRNNDYDKAMSIYESILNEDTTDAEAYWSILLCRYGVEYVEDPVTHRHVPTINRAQFTSVLADEDYKSAIHYADAAQREIYEQEAQYIDEVQKGILEISAKEEAFDVFICYKETDANGRRTQDSVLATELYHGLTNEGFHVFFSRITLEDKLGTAYEPYIFAALNSAKVMVVIGTKPEYLNAVWVKNEWSRYLALIKSGAKKTLIPAYRDMDPYDLPEEFSHLQAQDMSKLGFMQDIIRGIHKIIAADEPKPISKETVVVNAGTANVAPLLKRAFMFLEDGEWDRTDDFCEQVLNQNPECAEAYLGKLMAELHIRKQEFLKEQEQPFDNNKNYQKAIKFADAKLAETISSYVVFIKDKNVREAEEVRKNALYLSAINDFKTYNIPRLEEAVLAFTSLSGYKDSDERVSMCQEKIEQIKVKAEQDRIERERLTEKKRIEEEQAQLERKRKAEIWAIEEEKRNKKRKKISIIVTPIVIAIIAFIIILNSVIIPNSKYNSAVSLYDAEKYDEAIEAFTALNGYKDSDEQIVNCQNAIFEQKYQSAIILLSEKKYDEAYEIFEEISTYNNSSEVIKKSKYKRAEELYNNTEYDAAIILLNTIKGYDDSEALINKCEEAKKEIKYQNATSKYSLGAFQEAKTMFEELGAYKDSKEQAKSCFNAISKPIYEKAEQYLASGDWYKAATTFYSVHNYSNAKARSLQIWHANISNTTVIASDLSYGDIHSYAVTTAGNLKVTGELNEGYGHTDLSGILNWSNIISISANSHILGLKENGTVVAVGKNSTNQLDVSSWKNIVQIAAGDFGSFGVKSDGTVVSTEYIASSSDWREFDKGQNDISSWTDIVFISSSFTHTVGLKADGTVVAVGDNRLKQCNVDNWSNIVFIATDITATYGVKADGTVVTTQSGDDLSSWKNIKSISVGQYHTLGLKKDGTVVAVGSSVSDNGELNVYSWKNIVAVSAGNQYSIALKSDGTVLAIGLDNVDGRLDADGWNNILTP